MIWKLLSEPVAGIVRDIIGRVLPPQKISEEERLRLEQELKLKVMEYDWSELEAEIQDRADARALAQKELEKGNALTNAMAALHRPVWSFAMLALFLMAVLDKALGLPDIQLGDAERDIMRTVIVFYFGGRSVEKVAHAIRNGNGKPRPVSTVAPTPFTSGTGFRRGDER